jgi:hypothetical protein
MPKLIITSVGTSFTLRDETRDPFKGIEDEKLKEMIEKRIQFWENVETNSGYQATVTTWQDIIIKNLQGSLNTAELESLESVFKTQIGEPSRLLANAETDYIALLASNTYLGNYAADVIEQVTQSKILSGKNPDKRVWKIVVPKLNFNPDREESRPVEKGFIKELVKSFTDTVLVTIKEFQERCKTAGEESGEIIFNITGGFKGSVPFLTYIADRSKKRMVYLFEGTRHLVVINFASMTTVPPTGEVDRGLEDKLES